MQIRGLAFARLGQRTTVHQQSIPEILYRVRHKECLLVALVSSIQQAGRGHELNFARVIEKALDNGKREVGG